MAVSGSEEEILGRAFALLRGKERERDEAIRQIDRLLGKKLERYFLRHRVPEADAEELVWNVWLALAKGQFRGETRPIVWVYTLARNQLISYHRRERPEVLLDEEGWLALAETVPTRAMPAWIKLCIERALYEFERDHPERAEVLRMLAEEWSAKEVGEFFACNEGAARDRIYRTRERAREYLEPCRDST